MSINSLKELRFVLLILNYCQIKGLLPKPCNVVLFDAHHGSAPLRNMEEILKISLINKITILYIKNISLESCDPV
jgi:hypothetical protein